MSVPRLRQIALAGLVLLVLVSMVIGWLVTPAHAHHRPMDAASFAAPRTQPVSPHLVTTTAHPQVKTVALTFDDGPDAVYTPQVLALLGQYHLHATFCLIGTQARRYPDLVRAIATDGHRLCDHTMTHDERLPHRSPARIQAEIGGARQAIATAAPGAPIAYYRAPGGAWSPAVEQIAAGDGLQPLGWSVDPQDWRRPGTAAILATISRQLHPGGVILVHDGGGDRSQTLAALRQLIPMLLAQGYHFDFPA